MFFKKISNEDKILKEFIKKFTGYTPNSLILYKKAFIHKSVDSSNILNNNERLEFLGDSVLNNIITILIYNKFPNFDEGKLTQIRSKIVNSSFLSIISQKNKLTNFLKTRTSKLNEKHFYADTLEAFIGAFYLDKGFKKTYYFIENKVFKSTDVDELINIETNHKSKLFEFSQKNRFQLRFVTEKTIYDSNLFVSKIFIDDKIVAQGLGTTKKQAEQNASHFAIDNLNNFYKKNGQENLN